MCNDNQNILLDLDFSTTSDEVNWSTNSSNIIITDNDKLLLDADGNIAFFKRSIGVLSPTNNRIRIRSNFQVEQSSNGVGSTVMDIKFQLVIGSNVLYEGCVHFSDIQKATNIGYFLDRTFKYDSPIVAPISLNIIVPIGWENKIFLEDLKVDDFNFCEDNVRTYFIIDELLEDGLDALSAGIDLKSWKVDDVETLTPEFFSEISLNDGTPEVAWRYAKAHLDGSMRDNNLTPYNTFNPFLREFGLDYNSGTWYGDLPNGTLTGSDYGQGIQKIGFEKPAILNGNLEEKGGAFFIDIDYTKNLKIVFDVIVNKNSNILFFEPTKYREYTIEWNAQTCEKTFCWKSKNSSVNAKYSKPNCNDVLVDGFLSGLTGEVSTELVFNQDTKIFMFFDKSGSMNSTLAPLTTMKNTLLKQRLLPFYNNDETLYNSSVTITDVSGATPLPSGGQSGTPTNANERTLAMLNLLEQAPPTGNVVVMVFQDEAQPPYHSGVISPRTNTFDFDLNNLITRLDSFASGYYRGVIFQVNGSTVFKSLIQSLENGTPPYNGANGLSNRIEFGYNYDITDGGTPTYYLNLIVAALQNLGYAI